MTFQLSSFVPDIRAVLRDGDPGAGGAYYYSDTTILLAVIDAVRHLNSVRPTSRYGASGRLNDISFPTDETLLPDFDIDLDERWRLGIVYFAAARCYERDIKDTVHQQLAIQLKQQANENFSL